MQKSIYIFMPRLNITMLHVCNNGIDMATASRVDIDRWSNTKRNYYRWIKERHTPGCASGNVTAWSSGHKYISTSPSGESIYRRYYSKLLMFCALHNQSHVFTDIMQVLINQLALGHPVHTAPSTAPSDSAVTGPVGIRYGSMSAPTLRQGGHSDHTVSVWEAHKLQ
jgi:hypothetical protein